MRAWEESNKDSSFILWQILDWVGRENKKTRDNNNHQDGVEGVVREVGWGWGGCTVTAFPHPPAPGQGDLLVWALRCGTQRESCTGALSAQSCGLKPGKITSVNIVYNTQPNQQLIWTNSISELCFLLSLLVWKSGCKHAIQSRVYVSYRFRHQTGSHKSPNYITHPLLTPCEVE